MQTFAHITGGIVDVIETIPDGLIPGRDILIPAYANDLVAVPSNQVGEVKIGWICAGGSFSAPASTLSAAELRAYAVAKVTALLSIERTYALGEGVSVKCDASQKTAGNLTGLNAWAVAHPNDSTQWTDNELNATTITSAQAQALAVAASSYGQSVYNELGTVGTSINSGSITTAAQIDAASWPV